MTLIIWQVRARIEDIKCGTCRDRLLEALGAGMTRGGFPLTKLVKLAACHAGEDFEGGHSQCLGADGAAGPSPPPSPLAVFSNGEEISQRMLAEAFGGKRSDRVRIRAPVTPDLLKQVIGVVQTAATAAPTGARAETRPPRSGESALQELTAAKWLLTYPAPTSALLRGESSNGSRGTGTGSLAMPRARSSGVEESRDVWALMESAERAKDNAFKCCGIIEASTGVGVHDPTGSNLGSSGGSGSSAGSSNIDWNPNFAPRLQEAEAGLVDWLTELTMAVHGLTFPFTLAFITETSDSCSDGGRDLAETGALAEDMWTAYEESIKRQLDLTLEARREQLREQSQPMGIALCFAAQHRACAAELLERKRAEMTALHEATIGVLRAPERQPLLRRAEAAREKWSGLLIADGFQKLDDLVERVLRARLQVNFVFC